MTSIALEVVSVEVCHDWPLGKCRHGNECAREHHENLDPSLSSPMLKSDEYMVPDEVNAACQRCLQRMYPCDKLGRGGADDPCSECRWFGGPKCRCTLAKDTSYNDQIWSVMMNRGKAHNYTLPASKGREEFNAKKGVAPGPASNVKADWQGETKEALLVKPDMLPTGVRECPRASLVPPRASRAKQSAQNWAISNKRKQESDHDMDARTPPSTTDSAAPAFPPPLDFPRPPVFPPHGEALSATWSYSTNKWTYTFASGLEICSPRMPAPTGEYGRSTKRSTVSGGYTTSSKRQHTTPRASETTPMELDPPAAAATAATTAAATAMSPAADLQTEVLEVEYEEDDGSIGYQSSNDD